MPPQASRSHSTLPALTAVADRSVCRYFAHDLSGLLLAHGSNVMTDPATTWRVELLLLGDGHVVAAGESTGPLGLPLAAIEETPTRLLDALSDWLAPFEFGEITVLVRCDDLPILSWTTRSASMALYWAAVVLSKTWWKADTATPRITPNERLEGHARRLLAPT
jgi:hypothetical protein